MKLYAEAKQYKLYHGNMLEVIQPNSIDSIVCDPPYELNFMGKGWDNSGIAFNKETWLKCYEVLKPGGYLLAFGGTRTYHRIACAIEDAGFEIRDCIMYLYGSGFPKSLDISKAIDKRGAISISWFADYLKQILKDRNITTIELAELGHFYDKVNHGGAVSNWINSKTLPTIEQFNKVCKILDLPFGNIQECEREVIGSKIGIDGSIFRNYDNNYIGNFGNKNIDITVASSNLAKQWDGWGTALKPAYEPIIVARKPFKTSVAENIMQYGVGGINIDECRIEPTGEDIGRNNNVNPYSNGRCMRVSKTPAEDSTGRFTGRFPSNVIHDGSEEVIKDMPNTNGGERHNEVTRLEDSTSYGGKSGYINTRNEFNDSGSASRYFKCCESTDKDKEEDVWKNLNVGIVERHFMILKEIGRASCRERV